MKILIAIIIFSAIILFHEFGHFLLAKKNGVTVHEFSIGMGPKIYSREKNGTEYSLRILPIGGYVSMEGEEDGFDRSEEDDDLDIYVDVNYRCLDIEIGENNFFNSRIQFPFVRSVLLRINKNLDTITVHLMRDIDLFSAFANFELDLSNQILCIKNQYEKVIISKTLLDK